MYRLRMSIYVPGNALVSYVQSTLSGKFGGATAVSTLGSYVMANGSLCVEPITVISSFVSSEQREEAITLLDSLAMTIKDTEKQESVLVTCEEIMSVVFK